MAQTGDASLQRDFARAAREFSVPLPVLLSVAYNESRWEQHVGLPSTSGGYGVMHLTHVDRIWDVEAKGDGLVRVLRPAGADATFHTLDLAAALLHERAQVLERDPRQNIRGGAALLARYARLTSGTGPAGIAGWYGAVAAYSGSRDAVRAAGFAGTVFGTIRQGMIRTTSTGQVVSLAPQRVTADRNTLRPLHLQAAQPSTAECPSSLVCRFIPAAYQVNSSTDPTNYGNYDVASRPGKGLTIRYIVIHDTEGTYNSAIGEFQNPTRFASANYVIRSADGQITQMVRNKNVSWHAGNYYFNMHAIGIEHEGVAIDGAAWYGEQLYQSSARLVRYLAKKYHIPLDRAHIIGHDQVPGPTAATQSTQHWDPGPYWDWAHYMELLGSPISAADAAPTGIVTIDPDFASNQPPVTFCDSSGNCQTEPAQGTNFVYLRAAPDPSAPLLGDPALHPGDEAGTTKAQDWGDKAVTGQQFALVDSRGNWTAIDYGGREGWLYDPVDAPTTIATSGQLVTPRAGKTSIPVYGRAYPEKAAYPRGIMPEKIVTLQYSIPAGQSYVVTDTITADFYWSPTQTQRAVVTGKTVYDVISFNHRLALVKARDVTAPMEDRQVARW